MKKSAALIIVVAAVLSLGFQSAPAGWLKFVSEEGRFSVLMPGPDAPRGQSATRADPKAGLATVHRFTKKAEKGFFVALWVDYAPTFNLDEQGEINASRDNFLKGVRARLTSERAVMLDGRRGLEFTAETDQATFRSRVYVVGKRTYQLIAVTYKGFDDSANVNAFFSSFQLRPGDR